MANYPFKINIQFKDGSTKPHYTSSFATDAETSLSASAMVDKINLIPFGNAYTQDNEPVLMHPSRKFGLNDEGHKWLSASYTHENTGSVIFTDTEDTDNGGLDFYTFWGTKVCNVLGLPEGIPIYTETFKLSDDSSNPSNYLSGDVIADGVAIKESFKMAPQGRMRSNLVWDHQFGEGFLQWVSGSASKLLFGYDDQADTYSLSAASAATFNISGVDALTAGTIQGTTSITTGALYGSGGGIIIGKNTAAVLYGTSGTTVAHSFQAGDVTIEDGGLYAQRDSTSTFVQTVGGTGNATDTLFQLVLRNNTDTAGAFAGIAFQIENGFDSDRLNAAILAERVDSGAGDVNSDLVFATNSDADDDLFERMRIDANGNIGIGSATPSSLLHLSSDTADVTLTIEADSGNDTEGHNPNILLTQDGGAVDFSIGIQETGNHSYFDNNSTGRDWLFSVSGTEKVRITGDGKFGLGSGDPLSRLHIQQSTDNDDGGIRLYNLQDGTYWSQRINTSEYLYFQYNGGSYGGHIRNNSDVGQIDFTGQHRNSISTGTVNEHTSSIGYIVCADGTYDNLWDNNDNVKQDVKPNINESLPKVKLSNTAYDKTVFGVISELENNYQDTNVSESITYDESGERILTQTTSSVYVREYNQGSFTSTMEAKDSNDQKLIINSLGEGAIWVSNYSGSLENGDYITSSPIQGLGMKQDDDLLHNYTVAKITQDCTFDMNASASYDTVEFEWSGSNYKRAFVGCTYHCG